jgi:hypothetical protein
MRAFHAWLSHRRRRHILKSRHVWRFAGVGIALLLSWPAAAQTTFCDEIFEAAWTVKVFSNGPGLVIGAPASPGGSATHDCPIVGETALQLGAYRDVFEQVPAWSNLGDGVVWGVHIFTGNTYYPVTSGAIGTINISIDYECPDSAGACLNNDGQGFGPALQQGADYFVANTAGTTTGITGTPPGWSPHRTGPPLAALSFNKITAGGGKVVIDSTSHPDFSSAGGAIQCGFYTWNATEGGSFNNHAGYDNWQCVFTPPGVLKVCKAAGPGVALDTKFTFKYSSTAGSGKLTVPAGPAPGGYCVLGPPLPDGTIVTVTETNSLGIGIPVAGIVINGYPGGPLTRTRFT